MSQQKMQTAQYACNLSMGRKQHGVHLILPRTARCPFSGVIGGSIVLLNHLRRKGGNGQQIQQIIKSRIKTAKNFTNRLIKEGAKKNIGKIIEVLYETKDLSYTNNFYKVTIDSKNEKIEKMNGQIIKVKLKSFTNGKFFAEA